ncbi:MAG TPA: competence protein ComEA, partial [Ktedonobacter sp.]|nr:competence protein ComEA [Ktedonobacter sp.]
SSTTAQEIVNYRLQNGPYSSIDQLLKVVSKSIYDHIKGLVTIS